MLSALNSKMLVGGISCDLTNAFNCVNRELLSELNLYGIQIIPGQWFQSYFHDRKQQVEINTTDSNNSIYSHWGVIKHGVPRGSVFGPVLFLVYINDLSQTINTQSKLQ
jgi:hypothetical protein